MTERAAAVGCGARFCYCDVCCGRQRWRGFAGLRGMQTKLLALAFGLALVAGSCAKHSGSPAGQGNVYIAGDDGTYATLWTNGKAEQLGTAFGFASEVVAIGGDVYVSGVDKETNPNVANPLGPFGQYEYWKNGIGTAVGTPSAPLRLPLFATGGNDIYLYGQQLYKNGAPYSLPGLGANGLLGAATAVGKDVYFAGRNSDGNGAYWKNGVMHVFAQNAPAGSGVQVYCIVVSGSDVYIGGSDPQNQGVIWKNGQALLMADTWNVRSIFVKGSDVYTVSDWVTNSVNMPSYWKNGVRVGLPIDSATYGNATSIFVSGNDVYVSGYTSEGAVFWKNGVQTILSPRGRAMSISVR
jgi:hypothetical protein